MKTDYSFQNLHVRFSCSAQVAWRGVLANRLRSILTVLSVVIGVASVVSLMAIGEGARQAVVGQIASLGENVIIIRAEDPSLTFRHDLARDLVERVGTLGYATPVVESECKIRWRQTRATGNVLGVNEQFTKIRDHEVIDGRFFTQLHVAQRSRVAVLGYNLAASLLGGRSPVDTTLTIEGRTFRIIGVLAPKGPNSAGGIDDRIVVPYTVAHQISRTRAIDQIWGKAASARDTDLAMAHLSRIFRREVGLDPLMPDTGNGEEGEAPPSDGEQGVPLERVPEKDAMDVVPEPDTRKPDAPPEPAKDPKDLVSITSLNQMMKEADRANRVLSLLLGGIAAVSLLVGGIGIMNIMLMSVTERTGEIGLRKAVGAKRADLLAQFLMEAFMLSAAGGVMGLILGHAGTRLVAAYDLQAVITLPVALVAFGLALAVGVVFGVYPAWLASGLQPVDALRHQ